MGSFLWFLKSPNKMSVCNRDALIVFTFNHDTACVFHAILSMLKSLFSKVATENHLHSPFVQILKHAWIAADHLCKGCSLPKTTI